MKSYIADNKKTYDALADEYKDRQSRYTDSDQLIVDPFIEYITKRFGTVSLLEIGPGSGLNLAYFVSKGFKTWAIELSDKIIEVAKETSPQTDFYMGDFLEYDFKGQQFEAIFAKAFIHLFPLDDALKVFKKIKSLLVPHGLAFISTTTHDISEEGYFEKSDYEKKLKRFRRRWNENDLVKSLEQAGFSIVEKNNISSQNETGKKWVNIILEN